jgi:hypothetical protein
MHSQNHHSKLEALDDRIDRAAQKYYAALDELRQARERCPGTPEFFSDAATAREEALREYARAVMEFLAETNR